MTSVREIFWCGVTRADFFSIEHGPGVGPVTGQGQKYISISFRGMTYVELGRFLGLPRPSEIGKSRPPVTLPSVGTVYDISDRAPLTFRSRYRPPKQDDRYRIANQNRQPTGKQQQSRHPAWTSLYGFPSAPDDVRSLSDDRIPDLTYLKLFVAKLESGEYLAGFFNSPTIPDSLSDIESLRVLFEPYDESRSAGVIDLRGAGVSTWQLAGTENGETALSRDIPELVEAVEAVKRAAGRRSRGQGRRVSAAERKAIEMCAIRAVTAELESDGWSVEDVGLFRSYDLHCHKRDDEKRVEVKGTTGDGSAVILTPGEVRHARTHDVALVIVSNIRLEVDEEGQFHGHGGTLQIIDPWLIDEHGELEPTGYAYRLVSPD
jgi:Domain of unknown function (DUF3883)